MGQMFLAAPACGVPGRIPEGPRRLNGLQGGDGVENFVVFGEAEGLELGKHQPAVHPDFKGTAAALDEGGYVVEFVFDRALQTCSIGQVVSFAAVFNRDVHLGPPQQKSMVVSNNKGGILVISPGSVKRLSGSVQSRPRHRGGSDLWNNSLCQAVCPAVKCKGDRPPYDRERCRLPPARLPRTQIWRPGSAGGSGNRWAG